MLIATILMIKAKIKPIVKLEFGRFTEHCVFMTPGLLIDYI